MPMRGIRKRREHISAWARELAQSGKFDSWRQVELHVRVSGFPKAKIDDPFVKRELDGLCASAKQGVVDA